MAVRVVTDSTCDLPQEVVDELGIVVVPLVVRFGDDEYLDGVDIDTETFYRRLASDPVSPATSQPSVEAFRAVYEDLLVSSDGIVSVHLSGKLSGTMNSATLARADSSRPDAIELVDSLTTSCALGEVARQAAEVAASGADVAMVAAAAREAAKRVYVMIALDTIEYLRRGGRIGRAQALVGSLLSIRPIVHIEAGEVAPLERVRTRRKALDRVVELATEDRTAERVYVGGAGNPDDIAAVIERISPLLPGVDIVPTVIGPVIGVHVGPGAIGICRVRRR